MRNMSSRSYQLYVFCRHVSATGKVVVRTGLGRLNWRPFNSNTRPLNPPWLQENLFLATVYPLSTWLGRRER